MTSSVPPTDRLSIPGLHLLVGEWRGRGVADFPTIDRVDYAEDLRFEWDADREVLFYEQRAVLSDGTPSHRESGFLRVIPGGQVELWNVQDNGRTEVLRGSSSWDESAREFLVDLRGVEFGNDPRMLESRRLMTTSSERLTYDMSMATTTTPVADHLPHLRSELTRVP